MSEIKNQAQIIDDFVQIVFETIKNNGASKNNDGLYFNKIFSDKSELNKNIQHYMLTLNKFLFTKKNIVNEIKFCFEDIYADPKDFENYPIKKLLGFKTIKIGGSFIPYLGVIAGKDRETLAFFIYYNNNDKIEIFVPKDGNLYNTETNCVYGNNEKSDNRNSLKEHKCRYRNLKQNHDVDKIKNCIKKYFETIYLNKEKPKNSTLPLKIKCIESCLNILEEDLKRTKKELAEMRAELENENK